jgi:hypothetical protein
MALMRLPSSTPQPSFGKRKTCLDHSGVSSLRRSHLRCVRPGLDIVWHILHEAYAGSKRAICVGLLQFPKSEDPDL